MAKTYTFPSFVIPSGTLQVVIVTSQGSGSESVSYRYFTMISPSIQETENENRRPVHDSVEFEVEYDKDAFFETYIFPSLEDNGGYANVKLYHNGILRFYGPVNIDTVERTDWKVDSDTLANKKSGYHFMANWFLKTFEGLDVFGMAVAITQDANLHKEVVDANGITFYYASFFTILKYIFDWASISLSFDFLERIYFAGASSEMAGTYLYSPTALIGSEEQAEFPSGCGVVIARTVYNPYTLSYDIVKDAMFVSTFENALQLFTAIIDNFGLVMRVDYANSIATITDRITINEASINSIKTSSSVPSYDEYIDRVEIQSDVTGGTYKKDASQGSVAKFLLSKKINFDLTDSDLSGAIVAPNKTLDGRVQLNTALSLMRHIYYGSSLITNPYMEDNIAAWTAVYGTIAYEIDSSPIIYPVSPWHRFPYGSMKVRIDGTGAQFYTVLSGWINASLPFPSYFGGHLGFWIKGEAGITNLSIMVELIDNDFGVTVRESRVLPTVETDWRFVSIDLFQNLNGRNDTKRLRITMAGIAGANTSVWIDRMFFYKTGGESLAIYLGDKLLRHFSKSGTQKIVRSYDGIFHLQIGEFIAQDGENYYLRKIEKDWQKDETRIEAINYTP